MEQLELVKAKIHEIISSEEAKWWIRFRNPTEIWEQHSSYLVVEIVFYFLALLTFRHAMKNGGRYGYLWFTTILHGCVVECLSYFMPDIDNFWHAQSMVMLCGQRFPLHIVLFYPVFIYTAVVAVSRLRLGSFAEPFAVGLAVVLLDVPFDIMGVKLLFWTWHDTDPNVFDRHYWVPWSSYYFHAAFASSFSILFFGTRKLFTRTSRFTSSGCVREIFCSLITGLLAMPLGVVQFMPIYHPLHDSLHIHTEVCVFLFLSVYVLIVWTADRHPDKEARVSSNKNSWFNEIGLHVFIHFLTYIILAVFIQPENIRSTGVHETTGDCKETSPVHTAFGHVLSKKKYLCTTDYNEAYYDFHCLPGGQPPKNGLTWYTICGTPYFQYIEHVIVVTAFSLFGLYVYLQMLAFSGRHETVARVSSSTGGKAEMQGRAKKD